MNPVPKHHYFSTGAGAHYLRRAEGDIVTQTLRVEMSACWWDRMPISSSCQAIRTYASTRLSRDRTHRKRVNRPFQFHERS